jgi:hypothetical protein
LTLSQHGLNGHNPDKLQITSGKKELG